MDASCSIMVSDPPIVDKLAFRCWVQGKTCGEACLARLRELKQKYGTVDEETVYLYKLDTADQYRLYQYILQAYLEKPMVLKTQLLFRLDHDTQHYCIQKYYDFDASIFREFLGRMLSSKLRRDLDDLSNSYNLPLVSCIRQFDNLRCIYSYFEDTEFQGPLFLKLRETFLMSPKLSWSYTCVLFLLFHRFHIGLARKKFPHLPWVAFHTMASAMVLSWLPNEEYGLPIDTKLKLQQLGVDVEVEVAHDASPTAAAAVESPTEPAPDGLLPSRLTQITFDTAAPAITRQESKNDGELKIAKSSTRRLPSVGETSGGASTDTAPPPQGVSIRLEKALLASLQSAATKLVKTRATRLTLVASISTYLKDMSLPTVYSVHLPPILKKLRDLVNAMLDPALFRDFFEDIAELCGLFAHLDRKWVKPTFGALREVARTFQLPGVPALTEEELNSWTRFLGAVCVCTLTMFKFPYRG